MTDGEKLIAKIEGFAAAMKRQNIHVGMGSAPVVCVTCGKPWPCPESANETESLT